MIIKRNFDLRKVVWHIRYECLVSLLVSSFVYGMHHWQYTSIRLPFSVAGILGSALAIFIAFRNQSSYARWWEARTIWGNIVNSSRILARQIIANVNQALSTGKVTSSTADRFKKEMIDRQIAFAHSLRLHLRREVQWNVLQEFLSNEEYRLLMEQHNRSNQLLLQQGLRIKEAMQAELLGAFDNISLEPTLAAFNQAQGSCERIKNTPLPMNYQYFTKLFLFVFIVLLPFCLIGDFTGMQHPLFTVPVAWLISMVFAVMNKVGEMNEDPFENRVSDIPLTALCNTIERDLKEMLGEPLPPVFGAKEGYLF